LQTTTLCKKTDWCTQLTALCNSGFPDFIGPKRLAPKSKLEPRLQGLGHMGHTPARGVDDLKQRLIDIWWDAVVSH